MAWEVSSQPRIHYIKQQALYINNSKSQGNRVADYTRERARQEIKEVQYIQRLRPGALGRVNPGLSSLTASLKRNSCLRYTSVNSDGFEVSIFFKRPPPLMKESAVLKVFKTPIEYNIRDLTEEGLGQE